MPTENSCAHPAEPFWRFLLNDYSRDDDEDVRSAKRQRRQDHESFAVENDHTELRECITMEEVAIELVFLDPDTKSFDRDDEANQQTTQPPLSPCSHETLREAAPRSPSPSVTDELVNVESNQSFLYTDDEEEDDDESGRIFIPFCRCDNVMATSTFSTTFSDDYHDEHYEHDSDDDEVSKARTILEHMRLKEIEFSESKTSVNYDVPRPKLLHTLEISKREHKEKSAEEHASVELVLCNPHPSSIDNLVKDSKTGEGQCNADINSKPSQSDTDLKTKPRQSDTNSKTKPSQSDTNSKTKPSQSNTKTKPSQSDINTKTKPSQSDINAKTKPSQSDINAKTKPSQSDIIAKTKPSQSDINAKTKPSQPNADIKTKTKPSQPDINTKTKPSQPDINAKAKPSQPNADIKAKTKPSQPDIKAKTKPSQPDINTKTKPSQSNINAKTKSSQFDIKAKTKSSQSDIKAKTKPSQPNADIKTKTKPSQPSAVTKTKASQPNADIKTKASHTNADNRQELTKKKAVLPVDIVKAHGVHSIREEQRCSSLTGKEAVTEQKLKGRITMLFKRKVSLDSSGINTAGTQKGLRRGFLGFRAATE